MSRSEVKARWRTLLGLTLLVAAASGVVLTTSAGARRTATSFERFSGVALARDAKVQIDEPDLVEPVFAALDALPEVVASGPAHQYPVYVDPAQVDSVEFDFGILAPEDGRWANEVDRGVLLSGRRPDPRATHEVALNEAASAQSGLGPGDSLDVIAFTPEDLERVVSGEGFAGFNGPTITLEILGVVRQADELLGSRAEAGPSAIATPAFHAAYGDEIGGFSGLLALRLADPARDFDRVQQVLRESAGPDAEVEAIPAEDEFRASTESGIEVLAIALWVLTIVAALTAAVAVGGALRRQIDAHAGIAPTLSAIGCSRGQRALAVGAPIGGAVLAGVVLGAVASVAASTLLPIGLARRAEPAPGVDMDPAVLAIGSLAFVVAGVLWLAVITTRADLGMHRVEPAARSRRTGAVLRLGAAAGLGVHEGMVRRRGAAGTGALGVALGVAGLFAVATVVSSLDALIGDRARYGWGWSSEPDALEGVDGAVGSLERDRRVDAVGVLRAVRVEIGRRQLQGVALDVIRGDISVPILDGRAPATDEEIALGERTADRYDAAIGDEIMASSSDGASTRTFRLVGIAVFRPVDNPDPGDGALLTSDGLAQVARSGGFESLVLRYPEGEDATRLEQELAQDHPLEFSVYSQPRAPGNLANIRSTGGLLRWLGAFFVIVGLAAAGHSLVVSVGRRRRELSTLRALGFRRAQVRAAVRWQAVTLTVVGAMVGVPLGVAAGRGAWRLIVGDYGVVDHPANPVVALLLVLPVAVAVAGLVSWWPARRAASVPLARALRSE